MSELLDIVNEQDEVIGQADRDEVHRIGLLCRLVYVCFYTANGDIIFQKRSLTKKNDPGKLTTAASGHVSSGQSYVNAAIREAFEETGVRINPQELTNFGVFRADLTQGSYISNAMRGFFAYRFDGSLADLKVEKRDGAGFIALSIKEVEARLDAEPEEFAMIFSNKIGIDFIQRVKGLLAN